MLAGLPRHVFGSASGASARDPCARLEVGAMVSGAMLEYVVVWIDHHEARISQVGPDGVHSERVKAHSQPKHGRRYRQNDHSEADGQFFRDVAGALDHADEILVVGPSTAKLQFMRWMHQHTPTIEHKVVSVESADHPSDAQLAAHVKNYFHTDEQPA
jgi:stalled ribosome rescue protein Dom34